MFLVRWSVLAVKLLIEPWHDPNSNTGLAQYRQAGSRTMVQGCRHETAKPRKMIHLGWSGKEPEAGSVQDWGGYNYKWRELKMHPRKSFGCHLIFAFTAALFSAVTPILRAFNPLVQFIWVGLNTVWDQWCKPIGSSDFRVGPLASERHWCERYLITGSVIRE